MQYSRLLKRWLATKQLTPTEAAPLFGLSFQALYRHLSGENVPPLSRVPVLAALLGVPETRLRQLLRLEHKRRAAAKHGADAVAQPVGATATTDIGAEPQP